jgi:hypothetical protein
MDYHSPVGIVVAVKNEGPQLAGTVACGRRYAINNGFEKLIYARTHFGGNKKGA